ncbi:lipopolysaccharide biosynthesis protein [Psychrobacillus sp. L3]|uniref:lipopolysaccharide biosynthesis protein n=1 Tax=Psychrobacillus sp. L3 TaxID=3236891 RepID=UPI0036F2BAD1
MSYEVTKSKVLSSLFWKLMERGGTQGIQFIVTIVLARLLLPKEFGLIVLVSIFIAIAGVFVQSGFNTALIQKKDADEVDFSSVFYLSLIVASLLYIILFFSAPFIATYFEEPYLTPVIRCLSLTLFFGAFNSIQIAVIARNMQFKKLFVSSFGAIIISGILGIVMAYASFGVWALVGQQLTNQLLVSVILWFTVKWRPKLIFSIERIRSLFSFGWKLLASSLLDTLYNNIISLIIGKLFSPATLGFYNRGEQFPSLIVSNIDGSIQSVMLPTLSSYQNNKQRVKEIVRRSIVTSSFIVFPMMVGMATIAEPFIKIVLTAKWLPAVPFVQIFCASYAFWPIHTANLQAFKALGRSDVFLKLEIFKKILGLVILGISIRFGVYGLALGVFISSILSTFINAYPNLKLIDYSFQEQWKDIIPSLLVSWVMGAVVYSLQWIGMTIILTLIVQVLVGIVVYVGLAKVFRLESYTYLVTTGKAILKGRGERQLEYNDSHR